MSRKKEATAKQTTRQLIGIDEITDSGLKTSHGRLIFFAIKPTNLSVQPPEAVSNRIYALMTVLKGQAEIEMLALNSKESFEDNKRHYRQRAAEEDLPVISLDYAREIGVSQPAVHKRKVRILKSLKKLLEN